MIPNTILSTCKLTLKQIMLDDLVNDHLAAMSACFTGFTDPPNDDYIRQGQELATKRFGNLDVAIEADIANARRFSGDPSLDRGKYYTLCKDLNGNDEGTLVRELLSYHNIQTSGLVTIIDPTVPEHNDKMPSSLHDHIGCNLTLVFPPIDGRANPFATQFTKNAEPLYVNLPMRIFETEIDRVVDLRKPETASWFATSLSQLNWFDLLPDRKILELEDFRTAIHISGYNPSGFDSSDIFKPKGFNPFPFKRPLRSFRDLLPALLCQSVGGGHGTTRIAGLWLRKLGVNALIFPSARSDSHVLAKNGEVVEWSGFNLVDYRNVQPPKHLAAIDISVGWPKKVQTWPDDWTENEAPIVYETVNVSYEDKGPNKGSWVVQGIEMRRAAAYCFVELAWLFERLFEPDNPNVKNVLMMAHDSLQKTWRPDLSRDFVNALMGVPASRDRILRYISEPFFDRHLDLRESVQIVLQQTTN